jgi:hypothetical protein
MRPEMPELIVEIADEIGVKDSELIELAIEALLTKKKMKDQLNRYKEITS